jgi:hypothetical protein
MGAPSSTAAGLVTRCPSVTESELSARRGLGPKSIDHPLQHPNAPRGERRHWLDVNFDRAARRRTSESRRNRPHDRAARRAKRCRRFPVAPVDPGSVPSTGAAAPVAQSDASTAVRRCCFSSEARVGFAREECWQPDDRGLSTAAAEVRGAHPRRGPAAWRARLSESQSRTWTWRLVVPPSSSRRRTRTLKRRTRE